MLDKVVIVVYVKWRRWFVNSLLARFFPLNISLSTHLFNIYGKKDESKEDWKNGVIIPLFKGDSES